MTWTCTCDDDTGQALTFGTSASLNEMCIYIASHYTSSSDTTQLECLALSQNDGPAAHRTD